VTRAAQTTRKACDRTQALSRSADAEAFAEFIQAERRRYETIVRESGMTVSEAAQASRSRAT